MTDVLYCPCGAEMQIPERWTVVTCHACKRTYKRTAGSRYYRPGFEEVVPPKEKTA